MTKKQHIKHAITVIVLTAIILVCLCQCTIASKEGNTDIETSRNPVVRLCGKIIDHHTKPSE